MGDGWCGVKCSLWAVMMQFESMGAKVEIGPSEPISRAVIRNYQWDEEGWVIWVAQCSDDAWRLAGLSMVNQSWQAPGTALSEKAQQKQQKRGQRDAQASLTFDFQHPHIILCKPHRTESTTHCAPEPILQIVWTHTVITSVLWTTQELISSEFDCSGRLTFNWDLLKEWNSPSIRQQILSSMEKQSLRN